MANHEIDPATKLQAMQDIAALARRLAPSVSEFDRARANRYQGNITEHIGLLKAMPGVVEEVARRALSPNATRDDVVDALELDDPGAGGGI
jgi:hypothetical protein